MYDVFISYASEDKTAIAEPLANELNKCGYKVWFDEFAISVGDGLRRSIDRGMSNSRYGIVILSKNFFCKGWTNYELDGLVEMNIESPGILLPIWFNVSKKEVAEYSRSLSNIMAINASVLSIENIVQKLNEKLGEYYYRVNDDESLVRSDKKINIIPSDREAGSQVIMSINTDQLIDKEKCICTNEAFIYPYGDMNKYRFNYWQFRKGELNVITHMAYDCNTGKFISTDNIIEINDGKRLVSVVHFNRISDGPIKVVCKISTTNLHSGLFLEGFSDMGFNHGGHLEYFSYHFIMPDNKEFDRIKVFAENDECKLIRVAGKIEAEYVMRNVQPGTQTNFRFINELINK